MKTIARLLANLFALSRRQRWTESLTRRFARLFALVLRTSVSEALGDALSNVLESER